MVTLDVACGPNKTAGALGIDSNPRIKPDVLHDLNTIPYPFADDTFDRVVCYNGIEHLERPLEVLRELARISAHGAEIEISTPHFSSPDAYTDPTHIHALTSRSFDYLIPGTELFLLDYSAGLYEQISVRLTFIGIPRVLRIIVSRLANRHMLTYERHWAYLMPAHQLLFHLRVKK